MDNEFIKNPYKKFKKKTPFVKKEIIYDERKLYNYGINRLSVRDYGYNELCQKMSRYQHDIEMVHKVLDKLVSQGYLSDERRIRSMLIQYKSRESINKTKSRMLQSGFTKDQIEEVIDKIEEQNINIVDEDEFSEEIKKTIDLLIKKYKTFNKDNWDKMVRFLASKGFKYGDIIKGIKEFSILELDN
jgi:SOS response regulatory protein OraA/RecX